MIMGLPVYDRPVLAFDPGTNCGWALRLPSGAKLHGCWRLGRMEDFHGARLHRLRNHILKMVEDYNLVHNNVMIVYERVEFTQNPHSQAFLVKVEAIIQEISYSLGLLTPIQVNISSWRAFFLKHEGFLPSSRAPKETKNKSQWLKQKTVEKCQKIGVEADDFNEADAVGICFWAAMGGVDDRLVARKKDAEKEELKQAQGDLL